MQVTISDQLADELRTWVEDQLDEWPGRTQYHRDLEELHRQLDANLPTASEVAGIMQLGK